MDRLTRKKEAAQAIGEMARGYAPGSRQHDDAHELLDVLVGEIREIETLERRHGDGR